MNAIQKMVRATLVAAAVVVFVSLAIQVSDEKIPPRTPVLVDDARNLYYAPMCVDPSKREQTQLRVMSLEAAEARKYKLDDDCRNSGVFSTDGTSAAKFVLIKLGVLSYPRRWWNE